MNFAMVKRWIFTLFFIVIGFSSLWLACIKLIIVFLGFFFKKMIVILSFMCFYFRQFHFIFIKFEMKKDEKKANYSQLVNCDISRKLWFFCRVYCDSKFVYHQILLLFISYPLLCPIISPVLTNKKNYFFIFSHRELL